MILWLKLFFGIVIPGLTITFGTYYVSDLLVRLYGPDGAKYFIAIVWIVIAAFMAYIFSSKN